MSKIDDARAKAREAKERAQEKVKIARAQAQLAKEQPRPEKVPDPLANVDYDQGIEDSAQEELSDLLKGFKDRAKQEADRFVLATDSEFWFSVGFQSREQKEAFLMALDWLKYGDKYLNGCLMAKLEGIELPEVRLSDVTDKRDKKLAPLVMSEDE